MDRQIPADENKMHLSKAKGWLENDDAFFAEIDHIIDDRTKHVPRVLIKESQQDPGKK